MSSSTLVLDQVHHVVIIILKNNTNNISEVVGMLTSENSEKTCKISDTQFIRTLSIPRNLQPDQYTTFEEGKEYIKDLNLKNELDRALEKVIQYKPVVYNSVGITKKDITNIIKWYDNIVPLKIKKISHNEMDKQVKKQKENEEKAEHNKQKQKAVAEQAKKDKQAKISKPDDNGKD